VLKFDRKYETVLNHNKYLYADSKSQAKLSFPLYAFKQLTQLLYQWNDRYD